MKNDKRFVFIHDFYFYRYHSKIYGATQFSYERLWKTKYLPFCKKISVIARIGKDDNPSKYAILDGENVEFVDSYNMASINFLKNYIKNKRIILQQIKNADLVIVRLPSLQGLLACKLLEKSKKKYLIEVVGSAFNSFWYHDFIKGKIFAIFVEYLTKKRIKKAKNVTYVTDYYLQKKYINNNNKASFSDVIIHRSKNVIQKKIHNINFNVVKIGLCGSYDVNYKGHNIAIKIIKKISKQYNVELHFLGNGNNSRWVKMSKKYHIDQFIFYDKPNNTEIEMNKWYDNLDFLLIPSKTEGLPRVGIEAMSRGVSVISSDAGDLPYLLSNKNVFKKNNYNGMANRILFLLKNKNELINDIINNYEYIKKFDLRMINKMRDNYINHLL